MWVSLSPLLAGVDFVKDHDSVAAIETILNSAFRGEHIVFSDRNTLSHLLTVGLSIPSQAAIRGVQSRYSELASIESQQRFRVIIDPSIDQSHYELDNIWVVPLLHFADVALVPSCVLAENLRDATTYVNCAQHAQWIHGFKGIKVNLTKDSGGGADIPNKLGDLVANKRQFVMVITDTDRTHPQGASCAPTNKCAEIAAASNWVVEHQKLDCSEIENILPINLVCDAIEGSPAAHDLYERLDFLKKNAFSNSSLHKWFDVKNGTKLAKVKSNNRNDQERDHWIKATSPIENAFHCEPDCKTSHHCPKATIKECSCVLLPGLGDETLDRFNVHCATLTMLKQCERVRTSANASDWLGLGSIVASWGAALERLRS